MKKIYFILFAFISIFAISCTEDTTKDLIDDVVSEENGADVEGETIRFQLDVAEESRAQLSGVSISWQEGDCISVNKTLYYVTMVDGVPTIDVAVAADGVYEAYYPGNCINTGIIKFFRQTPMQFYVDGSFGPDAIPLFAAATVTDPTDAPMKNSSSDSQEVNAPPPKEVAFPSETAERDEQ